MYTHERIFVYAVNRSTEAFRGGNRDCRDAQRKWILGNVLLIRKISRDMTVPFEAEEIKTAREKEREKRREERKKSEDRSERVVEAERDLEPWKAPIAVARVRLPSKTRFIPQLLRASISGAHTNIKRHQYSETIKSALTFERSRVQ